MAKPPKPDISPAGSFVDEFVKGIATGEVCPAATTQVALVLQQTIVPPAQFGRSDLVIGIRSKLETNWHVLAIPLPMLLAFLSGPLQAGLPSGAEVSAGPNIARGAIPPVGPNGGAPGSTPAPGGARNVLGDNLRRLFSRRRK